MVKLTYRGFLNSLIHLHQRFGISIVLTSTHTEQDFSKALSELQTFLAVRGLSEVRNTLILSFAMFKTCICRGMAPTIQLDATACVLQIVALLIKDVSFIQKCNLIRNDTCFDPYLSCLDIISPLPRGAIKHVLITIVFGSRSWIQTKRLLKIYSKEIITDLYVTHGLVKDIRASFCRVIPNFKPFTKAISDAMIKSSSDGWLRSDGVSKTKIHYSKYSEVEVDYSIDDDYTGASKRHVQTLYIGDPISIDKTKTRTATLANYCHFIDSNLLTETVLCAHRKGFKVLTVHDAFIVNINNQQNLIRCYNLGLVKLISINTFNFKEVYTSLNIKDLTEAELRLIKSSAYSLVILYD
jgi:hypothetical protein